VGEEGLHKSLDSGKDEHFSKLQGMFVILLIHRHIYGLPILSTPQAMNVYVSDVWEYRWRWDQGMCSQLS
jgi:hypothetical protein